MRPKCREHAVPFPMTGPWDTGTDPTRLLHPEDNDPHRLKAVNLIMRVLGSQPIPCGEHQKNVSDA